MIQVVKVCLLLVALDSIERCTSSEIEQVQLPTQLLTGVLSSLRVKAFGNQLHLNLTKNNKLLSPKFQVWRHDKSGSGKRVDGLDNPSIQFYLHKDQDTTAAISHDMRKASLWGQIHAGSDNIEFSPANATTDKNFEGGVPYVMKRSLGTRKMRAKNDEEESNEALKVSEKHLASRVRRELASATLPRITIELAIFMDAAVYNTYAEYFGNDISKIRDMMLAYVNQMQALFHHPSLGEEIDLSLVRLSIFTEQPEGLDPKDGLDTRLLMTFCNYAKAHNRDANGRKIWDIGLYVTSIDIYNLRGPQDKSFATTGIAVRGGACSADYSCAVTELGTNKLREPLMAAGFHSVYMAVHEIAHTLGMYHDSEGNTCPSSGFIMSSMRNVLRGESNTWSSCSRKSAEKLRKNRRKGCLLSEASSQPADLNHHRFESKPGRTYSADEQCKLRHLSRKAGAVKSSLNEACSNLKCEISGKTFMAGPALDGTSCGGRNECVHGECVIAQ